MKRSLALSTALALAGLLGVAGSYARAETIFVHVEGQVQGIVENWHNPYTELGEVSLADHGLVEHMAWSVVSPRDAASGLPTGKRQHKPLTIGVRMSAATLMLASALRNNENVETLKLLFFVSDPETGVSALTRTLTLTNASLSSLSAYTVRDDDELTTFFDVGFTYQKVGIEDHEHGVSYEDDWESPIAAPQIP